MGFLIHTLIFLRPGRTVKVYFSVPVVLYTVFLRPSSIVHCIFCVPEPLPKTLVKHLAKNLEKNSGQLSGHADNALKTLL